MIKTGEETHGLSIPRDWPRLDIRRFFPYNLTSIKTRSGKYKKPYAFDILCGIHGYKVSVEEGAHYLEHGISRIVRSRLNERKN